MTYQQVIPILQNGGVAVIPTDTLYGLVGLALNREAVEKIYELKQRDHSKGLIVLIGDETALEQFDLELTPELRSKLADYWPGPVTIILKTNSDNWNYLNGGQGTIAFRLPADERLRELLRLTGPLVAPSANPEGEPPAQTITEAEAYFGEKVPAYVDGGTLLGPASKIIDLSTGEEQVVRTG